MICLSDLITEKIKPPLLLLLLFNSQFRFGLLLSKSVIYGFWTFFLSFTIFFYVVSVVTWAWGKAEVMPTLRSVIILEVVTLEYNTLILKMYIKNISNIWVETWNDGKRGFVWVVPAWQRKCYLYFMKVLIQSWFYLWRFLYSLALLTIGL